MAATSGATTAVSATAGGGGAHAKAGKRKEPVEWGVYLRTPEDEERTKREWEKEHREWIEDQVRNGEGLVRVLSPSFRCVFDTQGFGLCYGRCHQATMSRVIATTFKSPMVASRCSQRPVGPLRRYYRVTTETHAASLF